MTRCPHPIGYYRAGNGDMIPAPCHSWLCPVCGPVMKNKLLDRVKRGFSDEITFDAGYRMRMLTLTVRSDDDDINIMKYWNRLRASLRKYDGGRYHLYKFFWVKEFTPPAHEYTDYKGEKRVSVGHRRHLHVMIPVYIPWQVVRFLWRLASDNPDAIVYINDFEVANPAAYMSKYMTKDSTMSTNFKRRERRYGMSRSPAFRAVKFVPKEKLSFVHDSDTGRHLARSMREGTLRPVGFDMSTKPPDAIRNLRALPFLR